MSSRSASLPCVVVGPADFPEFAAAVAVLRARCRVQELPDPAPRRPDPSDLDDPRLGVLLQRSPGQWSAGSVAALQRRFPFCRWLTLFAAGCGGEERSGRPWPGTIRIEALRGATALGLLLDDWAGENGDRWDENGGFRPATFTAEDHFLADLALPWPQSRGPVAVMARDATAAMLGELLRQVGRSAVRIGRNETPPADCTLLLWDDEGEREDLRGLADCAARSVVPVWACLSLPRPQDAAGALSAGAAAVIPKPFALRELAHCLARTAA